MDIKKPKPMTILSKEDSIKFVEKKMLSISVLTENLNAIISSFDYDPKPSKLEALFLDPRLVGSDESMRDIFLKFNANIVKSLAEINSQAKNQDPQIVAAMRKEFVAGMAKNSEWVKLCNMPESTRQVELQKLIDSNAELVYSREFSLRGLSFTPVTMPEALFAMK